MQHTNLPGIERLSQAISEALTIEKCSICLQKLEETVLLWPCAHWFCQKCTRQLHVKAGKKAMCPLCNATTTRRSIVPFQDKQKEYDDCLQNLIAAISIDLGIDITTYESYSKTNVNYSVKTADNSGLNQVTPVRKKLTKKTIIKSTENLNPTSKKLISIEPDFVLSFSSKVVLPETPKNLIGTKVEEWIAKSRFSEQDCLIEQDLKDSNFTDNELKCLSELKSVSQIEPIVVTTSINRKHKVNNGRQTRLKYFNDSANEKFDKLFHSDNKYQPISSDNKSNEKGDTNIDVGNKNSNLNDKEPLLKSPDTFDDFSSGSGEEWCLDNKKRNVATKKGKNCLNSKKNILKSRKTKKVKKLNPSFNNYCKVPNKSISQRIKRMFNCRKENSVHLKEHQELQDTAGDCVKQIINEWTISQDNSGRELKSKQLINMSHPSTSSLKGASLRQGTPQSPGWSRINHTMKEFHIVEKKKLSLKSLNKTSLSESTPHSNKHEISKLSLFSHDDNKNVMNKPEITNCNLNLTDVKSLEQKSDKFSKNKDISGEGIDKSIYTSFAESAAATKKRERDSGFCNQSGIDSPVRKKICKDVEVQTSPSRMQSYMEEYIKNLSRQDINHLLDNHELIKSLVEDKVPCITQSNISEVTNEEQHNIISHSQHSIKEIVQINCSQKSPNLNSGSQDSAKENSTINYAKDTNNQIICSQDSDKENFQINCAIDNNKCNESDFIFDTEDYRDITRKENKIRVIQVNQCRDINLISREQKDIVEDGGKDGPDEYTDVKHGNNSFAKEETIKKQKNNIHLTGDKIDRLDRSYDSQALTQPYIRKTNLNVVQTAEINAVEEIKHNAYKTPVLPKLMLTTSRAFSAVSNPTESELKRADEMFLEVGNIHSPTVEHGNNSSAKEETIKEQKNNIHPTGDKIDRLDRSYDSQASTQPYIRKTNLNVVQTTEINVFEEIKNNAYKTPVLPKLMLTTGRAFSAVSNPTESELKRADKMFLEGDNICPAVTPVTSTPWITQGIVPLGQSFDENKFSGRKSVRNISQELKKASRSRRQLQLDEDDSKSNDTGLFLGTCFEKGSEDIKINNVVSDEPSDDCFVEGTPEVSQENIFNVDGTPDVDEEDKVVNKSAGSNITKESILVQDQRTRIIEPVGDELPEDRQSSNPEPCVRELEDRLTEGNINRNIHCEQDINNDVTDENNGTDDLVFASSLLNGQQSKILCLLLKGLNIEFSKTMDQRVTHLIVSTTNGCTKNTYKVLYAMALHKPIIRFEWVEEVLTSGTVVPMDPYVALGPNGECAVLRAKKDINHELLHRFAIHVFNVNELLVTKEQLEELITLCGGTVAQTIQQFKDIPLDVHRVIIIGEAFDSVSQGVSEWRRQYRAAEVSTDWLFNTIGGYKVAPLIPYMIEPAGAEEFLLHEGYPENIIHDQSMLVS